MTRWVASDRKVREQEESTTQPELLNGMGYELSSRAGYSSRRRSPTTSRGLPVVCAVAVMVLLSCSSPAHTQTPEAYEVWESSYLFTRVVANVHTEGSVIEGVAWVHGLCGEPMTYHFSGTVSRGTIRASHSTGHVFCGALDGDGKAAGVLTTSKGWTIRVEARRKGPMAGEDLEAHP